MKSWSLWLVLLLGLGLDSRANVQFSFPVARLGTGPYNTVQNLSADAILVVDGVEIAGRLPANQIFQGGSPEQVSLVWAYDSDFAEWLEGDGALVQLRNIRLTLTCPDGSNSLSQTCGSSPILYELGSHTWFTQSCPPQTFPTLVCGCTGQLALAPSTLDFGRVGQADPVSMSFWICNPGPVACPPVAGSLVAECPAFSVFPEEYLVPGDSCQEVVVTFVGSHAGPTSCEIVTTHGVVTCVVDDEVAATEGPAGFGLGEAVPNPFNPTTTLSYSVPETEVVTLKVYNTQGQLVRTLVNGLVERGEHKVVFDAAELASGVYVSTLTSATRSAAARKLLLVK
ncbi:MAG: T9SS type A sorting domain-containing protein [Candidatus Delongbacteria bacterium]